MSWDEPLMSWPRGRSKIIAPGVTVLDIRGRKIRGGQVWRIDGDDITVKIQAEAWCAREYVVPRSLFDGTGVTVTLGAPILVKVEGETPDTFQVVAVRGGRPTYPRSDDAASVLRGEFWPAELNGVIRGVPMYLDDDGPGGGAENW